MPIVWDNGYQDKTKSAFALFDRKNGEETEPDLVKAIMKGKQEGEK